MSFLKDCCFLLGWSLGEHGEFAKYENMEVTTRIPMMV